MRLVRVKIANGSFVNLAYDEQQDKWSTLLQVPSETSYFQPDHKYGLVFEAWDEENHNVIYDRTDETFGDELAVRVRERTTPLIELIKPARPFIIDVSELNIEFNVTDLGGSTLDLDSILLKFYDDEFDLDNEYMTVTPITNGVNVVFNPPFFIQDGEYEIEITAEDYDDNMSKLNFSFIVDTDPCEFITDRTEADVQLVKELRQKYLDGTITEEEKALFAQDLKGARNRSDLLRILINMEYLAEMFTIDYDIDELPEIPNANYIQEMRDWVAYFRSNLPIHADTPFTPKLPINTYKKMNDLEKILFDIHDNLQYRFKYYCDDGLYCDAPIGTLE